MIVESEKERIVVYFIRNALSRTLLIFCLTFCLLDYDVDFLVVSTMCPAGWSGACVGGLDGRTNAWGSGLPFTESKYESSVSG